MENTKRINNAIDVIKEHITILDDNYLILDINREALNFLNLEKEKVLSKKCYEILGKKSICQHCGLEKVYKTKKFYTTEFYVEEINKWLNQKIYPVLDDNNNIDYVVEHIIDITDRKNIEEEAEKFSKEIMRSNRDLEQYAYAISHDLQEPLQTVKSFCQLLEEDFDELPDDKKKRFINNISESTSRMIFLIKDLLDFSRIGETSTCVKEKVNLKKIIDDEIKDFSIIIKETGAKINYYDLPEIKSVEVLIRQLFHNLISNSLKFRSEKSPKIDISCYKLRDKWFFKFKDNGIGIDKKHHNRIFGVFKRIHTDKEYNGTGIGLAVCDRIINHLGGDIWLESKPNEGTTFYFTLKNDF